MRSSVRVVTACKLFDSARERNAIAARHAGRLRRERARAELAWTRRSLELIQRLETHRVIPGERSSAIEELPVHSLLLATTKFSPGPRGTALATSI